MFSMLGSWSGLLCAHKPDLIFSNWVTYIATCVSRIIGMSYIFWWFALAINSIGKILKTSLPQCTHSRSLALSDPLSTFHFKNMHKTDFLDKIKIDLYCICYTGHDSYKNTGKCLIVSGCTACMALAATSMKEAVKTNLYLISVIIRVEVIILEYF